VTDAQAIGDSLAEPEAFAVLFDRHFDAVHGYAQRRVGLDRRDRRRDLYARFRPTPSLRRQPCGRPALAARDRRESSPAPLADRAAPARLAPPVAAELATALLGVPRREREPLLLLAWADLSYEEIGVALGVPIGTVRSRISRGRARLRGPNRDSHRPQEAPNNG